MNLERGFLETASNGFCLGSKTALNYGNTNRTKWKRRLHPSVKNRFRGSTNLNFMICVTKQCLFFAFFSAKTTLCEVHYNREKKIQKCFVLGIWDNLCLFFDLRFG